MSILDTLKADAAIVFPDNQVLQDLCIVQGCLESGLPNNPSDLATKYKNLFGIKKAGTAGLTTLSTTEYINGRKILTKASFGMNLSYIDSVKQYKQILDLDRYEDVRNASNFEEAAKAIVDCGYCTDPTYTGKLLQLYNELGMTS